MSRKTSSLASLLVQAPWPVSAGIGVVLFVFMKWVVPKLTVENVIAKSFAHGAPSFSIYVLLFFAILAGLSWLLRNKKRKLVDSQQSIETLRALSWQQFEWMTGEAYRRQGYKVDESIEAGPDGGIDLVLRKDGQTILVQCKRWKTQSVGAPIVRELFGLLNHHQASRAIVVTCGHFSREAVEFAEGKPIELIDGPALLNLVKGVRYPIPSTSEFSLTPAENSVPTPLNPTEKPVCPTCDAAMVRRTAKRGANAGQSFWGCSAYPKCRGVRDS